MRFKLWKYSTRITYYISIYPVYLKQQFNFKDIYNNKIFGLKFKCTTNPYILNVTSLTILDQNKFGMGNLVHFSLDWVGEAMKYIYINQNISLSLFNYITVKSFKRGNVDAHMSFFINLIKLSNIYLRYWID